MISGDLHAVTVRPHVHQDTVIEEAAALPPDRAVGVVMAILISLATSPGHPGFP